MMNVRFGAQITAADVANAKAAKLSTKKQTRELQAYDLAQGGSSTGHSISTKGQLGTWNSSPAKDSYISTKTERYQGMNEDKLKAKYKRITGNEWVG